MEIGDLVKRDVRGRGEAFFVPRAGRKMLRPYADLFTTINAPAINTLIP